MLSRFLYESLDRVKKLLVLVSVATCLATIGATSAKELSEYARDMRAELVAKVLPYWFDTAQDKEHGGYLLADDAAKGRSMPREKQLVSQSRMVWGFAHAHLNGFSTAQRNYLKAAEQGYHFLLDHFLDKEHGGCYWKTDLAGQVTDPRKIVYGESFVIYALVEYHRASGLAEPLRRAMALYQNLQQHAHDAKNGGWVEHFERDWTPLPLRAPNAEVEIAGLKSANTHLHLMEALTELFAASHDATVKKSLAEAVRLNTTYFYPKDPGQSAFHREPDWKPVTDPRSAGLSYGHNVEFAWLLIHAQQVLGQRPSWGHFTAHIEHALQYGYDYEHGGLYYMGSDNQPATRTDKEWWVEAEMMAALTEGIKHQANPTYASALEKLIQFVWKFQVNPADGIWLSTVTADGKPKSTSKANAWKANYHDVRAMVKFIEAFGAGKTH